MLSHSGKIMLKIIAISDYFDEDRLYQCFGRGFCLVLKSYLGEKCLDEIQPHPTLPPALYFQQQYSVNWCTAKPYAYKGPHVIETSFPRIPFLFPNQSSAAYPAELKKTPKHHSILFLDIPNKLNHAITILKPERSKPIRIFNDSDPKVTLVAQYLEALSATHTPSEAFLEELKNIENKLIRLEVLDTLIIHVCAYLNKEIDKTEFRNQCSLLNARFADDKSKCQYVADVPTYLDMLLALYHEQYTNHPAELLDIYCLKREYATPSTTQATLFNPEQLRQKIVPTENVAVVARRDVQLAFNFGKENADPTVNSPQMSFW
jgi:hypothetical protein